MWAHLWTQMCPMSGHTNLGLDGLLKVRVEPELKRQLNEIARRRKKKTAQMLREVLWDVVEREDPLPSDSAISTPVVTGA